MSLRLYGTVRVGQRGEQHPYSVYRGRASLLRPAGLHAYLNAGVGHEATVRLLLDNSADVAHVSKSRSTALIFASENGHAGTGAVVQFGHACLIWLTR